MLKRGLAVLAAAGLGIPVALGVAAVPASATTTITVANANDSGAGSLRQAFVDASSGGADQNGDVTIAVPSEVGNITLTSGELQYDGGNGGGHSLTVTGAGQTISTSTSGGMDVNTTGTLTVNDLRIAISSDAGDGIFSTGHVSSEGLTITGADEGIIAEGTTMTLTDTQVTDSVRTGVEALGNIVLIRSTIANNHRYGVDTNQQGDAILTNSTVTNNATESSFTGINAANVVLKYATITGNGTNVSDHNILATGNILSFGSVITGQGHGGDCSFGGSSISQGYNFADDTSCNLTGTGDSQSTSNAPMLGALGNNGGPTDTRVPQAGSPLLDAIPTGSCAAGVSTDQRSVARPQGSGCDIGAVEVAVNNTTTTTTPGSTTPPATPAAPVNAQPSLTG